MNRNEFENRDLLQKMGNNREAIAVGWSLERPLTRIEVAFATSIRPLPRKAGGEV